MSKEDAANSDWRWGGKKIPPVFRTAVQEAIREFMLKYEIVGSQILCVFMRVSVLSVGRSWF